MSKLGLRFLDKRIAAQSVLRWARAARLAPETDLATLRRQCAQAGALRTHLDQLIRTGEERLALPPDREESFSRPHNADWEWRPFLWRGPLPFAGLSSVGNGVKLGEEITLFHDCPHAELTLRQLRNLRAADLAPYGLRLDVFQFRGSFLSLAIDLPQEASEGLKRRHLLRMDAIIEMEQPLEIFARLNIRNGPNTEQLVRELPLDENSICVEFDLAYSNLNEKRVDGAWIDLIFEGPRMNQVTLRDLTFSRRPRAPL